MRFRRAQRIVDGSTFEQLLRHGRRQSMSGFTFYVGRNDRGAGRLGLMVTRRNSKQATYRNALKRRIREAFRLEAARLEGVDVLVRPPIGLRPSRVLVRAVRDMIARLAR